MYRHLIFLCVLFTPFLSFANERHVHLMHLDGFRGDVFYDLLGHGQLPHFKFLLSRGKVSYKASTVDKSETMKVIHSYLTSRRSTEVVGWWQFDRDRLQFENYWLDPIGVADFALGVRFPLYPTIFDYLVSRGENVASGFGLHRRSVKFENYTRNYVEGFKAAIVDHNYFYQCHRTMESILNLYRRFAENADQEKFPVLVTSLLAAADEFGHLEGILQKMPSKSNFCVKRESEGHKNIYESVFQLLEDQKMGHQLSALYHKGLSESDIRAGKATAYFTNLIHDENGKISEFCFRIPELEFHAIPSSLRSGKKGFASPHYILAMMLIDMEVGNLINVLRSIRFNSKEEHVYVENAGDGIEAYLKRGISEGSLFEQTLFVFLGDHGMLDTKYMMAPPKEDPYRADDDIPTTFLRYLNNAMGLDTVELTRTLSQDDRSEIGIDDMRQPRNLFTPHQVREWQSPEIQALTDRATREVEEIAGEILEPLAGELSKKISWIKWGGKFGISLFRSMIAPKLEAKANAYGVQLLENIPRLYLKAEPAYVQAENKMREAFYEKHVRLIYGGGARNNAELFLPGISQGKYTWKKRPAFSHILSYRNGSLMKALARNDGVGLIFIRKNNEKISAGHLPNDPMQILVMDRFGRKGTITVKKDRRTLELLFAYEADPSFQGSTGDPLDYGRLGMEGKKFRTYNEWNDLSIRNDFEYHNVVAGIGTYLYSDNSAIGDILLMNSQGWNFGDNAGGHGGVHKEEKQTVMLISGPGIETGELFSTDGHYPTVVDAVPTILHWLGYRGLGYRGLGYGERALTDFSRNGFKEYFTDWVSRQRQETTIAMTQNLGRLALTLEAQTGLKIDLSPIEKRLERFLKFIPTAPPLLPNFHEIKEDGNLLGI